MLHPRTRATNKNTTAVVERFMTVPLISVMGIGCNRFSVFCEVAAGDSAISFLAEKRRIEASRLLLIEPGACDNGERDYN